jgi:hypothetical protein
MAVTKVTLNVAGQPAAATVVTNTPTVLLTAKAEPAGETVNWTWTKDGKAVEGVADATLSVQVGTQAVVVTATAKSAADGTSKTSDPLTLEPKAATPAANAGAAGEGAGDPVSELAVGEYDPQFALVAGATLGFLAVLVILLLNGFVADTHGGSAAEQLRLVAVTGAMYVGALLLAAGAWLAAIETRGRARRVAVSARSAPHRGATAEDVGKVLDAARRLRGTIAVLAAGTALLLGALWTVGRASIPAPAPAGATSPPTAPAPAAPATTPPGGAAPSTPPA